MNGGVGMTIKEGDRVRIKNYSPDLDGEEGVVHQINGEYVMVFPDCQPDNSKYPIELYSCEVEKIEG